MSGGDRSCVHRFDRGGVETGNQSSHEVNRIELVYSGSEKCFAIGNVREMSGVQFGL